MSKRVSHSELAQHNKADNAWLVINGDVYDVSRFAMLHPGGERPIHEYAGKDATDVFYGLHMHAVLEKFGPRLLVGRLEGAEEKNEENTIPGLDKISKVPYGEPMAFQGFESPYYKESHHRMRKAVREFIHEHIRPEAEDGEMSNEPPSKELFKKMGEFGLLAARIGPGDALNYVKQLPGGVSKEEFDYFHEGIVHEEMGRIGCPGFTDGLGSGMVIGLPPVVNFGSDWMKEKVCTEVLSGEKRIALAITEPYAGSDVANITTTATKMPDGSYVVNGEKKWITGGNEADYFTTAVRTGGEGMGGISLLLIERSEGVTTKRIKTSYSTAAGTAYITFENVKVPAKNLIGFENGGFFLIMANFNHERWMICAYLMSSIRAAVEQTMLWCNQRKAFGKNLLQQPAVRQKLANMIAQVEAVQHWYEAITHQMCTMPYEDQTQKLSSPTSLLKYQVTRAAHDICDDAVQLFGGRSITQTGMGKYIERFQKTYKFGAILGGSEEIMADLGVRLALKDMPKNARL
mmetsp:Transcript_14754/g.19357  ORF Transcript_14754/g.19357 Transcript_14754/m.19357 type:complete len:518 (+) Transcript_14754:181-1734(+)